MHYQAYEVQDKIPRSPFFQYRISKIANLNTSKHSSLAIPGQNIIHKPEG